MITVNGKTHMKEGDWCPTCPLQGKPMTKVVADNRGRNYRFKCPKCFNKFTIFGELYMKKQKRLRSMGNCPKCGYLGSLVGSTRLHCHVCKTMFMPDGTEYGNLRD